MTDFFCAREVIGRKPHRCEQCGKTIAIGERHRYFAGVIDGDFNTAHEHFECFRAWVSFNEDCLERSTTEGQPFLIDDGDLDREFLEEFHPIVAARIWPVRLVKNDA